jgi:hypothetical protein
VLSVRQGSRKTPSFFVPALFVLASIFIRSNFPSDRMILWNAFSQADRALALLPRAIHASGDSASADRARAFSPARFTPPAIAL